MTGPRCTNSEPGWFNGECGKPAVWMGARANGYSHAFCDGCKREGWERAGVVSWCRIAEDREARGRRLYEADLIRKPNYWPGSPRPPWAFLSEIAKQTWRNAPPESAPVADKTEPCVHGLDAHTIAVDDPDQPDPAALVVRLHD